jgi:uncharacterized protein (UPF0264 family)
MPMERLPGRDAPLFLASVTSVAEALAAIAGGADLIDCKDPASGALGGLPLETIRAIRAAVPRANPLSATIGDLASEPEPVAAAALAVSDTGVDYVKVGIFPGGDARATIERLGEAFHGTAAAAARPGRSRGMLSQTGADAASQSGEDRPTAGLIGLLLADREPDLSLIGLMASAGFKGVMLDTAGKARGALPQVMPRYRLQVFIREAHRCGMLAGLAGSLQLSHIALLASLKPDILGFRGAICRGRDRIGALDPKAVAAVRTAIDRSAGTLRGEAQRA